MSDARQFIPAETGWFALFEEGDEDGVSIHAEPVVAWSFETNEDSKNHHAVSFGQAVIAAGPWIEGAEHERSGRFFALVHEDQLEADLVDELAAKRRKSRDELMERAELHRSDRREGHASWVHERRSHRSHSTSKPPTRLF